MGGCRKTSSKTQNPCIAKMMRGFVACLQGGKKTMRHKDVVRIGCGAGFAGDRPAAALRLLQKVPDMHYLVLECLAERTLAVRYQTMVAGGKGFDPRISEWMRLLLPTAVRKGVCLITNMGAVDVLGAQEEVMRVAAELGMSITVAVAYELLDYVAGASFSSMLP
jgi:hypothetical protein